MNRETEVVIILELFFTNSSAELAGVYVHITDMSPKQAGDLRWPQVYRAGREILSFLLLSFQQAIGWHPFKNTQVVVEGRLRPFNFSSITINQLGCEVLRIVVSARIEKEIIDNLLNRFI